jgi:Fur family ferric uptake transcriptional regulator
MERSTRQRTAIRTAIEAAARPLTPQEILSAVRESVPEIGIATIYRNLKLLLDEGTIEAVNLPGGNARYEMHHPAHHHHHHFHCSHCDRVFDVQGCPGSMDNLAPDGFLIERHEITLYGLCADCAKLAALPKQQPPAPASN